MTSEDSAPVALLEGTSLARYTTLRIGGPAQYAVVAQTVEDIQRAASHARTVGLPLWLIGRGSNLLIDSAGLAGISLLLRRGAQGLEVHADSKIIRADTSVSMPRIASEAMKAGLTGLEHLMVIPGTIGAGVAINAGVGGPDGQCVAQRLSSVRVLDPATGSVRQLNAQEAGLRYRGSRIQDEGLIVLSVELLAGGVDSPASIAAKHRLIQQKRIEKQPVNPHTCGSVFKAVDGVPAGRLIDQCGLRGKRIGAACISERHANWIENLGGAHSDDVRRLVDLAREAVLRIHGVILEREMRIFPDDGN